MLPFRVSIYGIVYSNNKIPIYMFLSTTRYFDMENILIQIYSCLFLHQNMCLVYPNGIAEARQFCWVPTIRTDEIILKIIVTSNVQLTPVVAQHCLKTTCYMHQLCDFCSIYHLFCAFDQNQNEAEPSPLVVHRHRTALVFKL